MKPASFALAFLACTAIASVAPAMAGQAPGAASDQDIPINPPRPDLFRRTVLQHRLSNRSGRQQAGRRHQARRPATGQFQPAL
jgi:hypothetical protein